MAKNKHTFEYEINAPASLLYSYITTPQSLKQWFADDVKEEKDGIFNFIWDKEDHKAKLVSFKVNQFAKFDFMPLEDQSSIEFRLETNELTQTTFLKIQDSTSEENENDAGELWNNLIADLKETLGA